MRPLRGHFGERMSFWTARAATPEGRRAVSVSGDGTAKLWDLESGRCVRTLGEHTDGFWAVATSPDGTSAVTGSGVYDQTVREWDLEVGAELACFYAEAHIGARALASDGTTVVVGDGTGRVHFLRLENVALGSPILTAWLAPQRRRFWQRTGRYRVGLGCPLCRAWSTVPESALGTELPCPNCGKMVKLNPFVIKGDWRPVAAAWRGDSGE